MSRLAGTAAKGRACGTAEENAAARFVAGRLRAYRVEGGGVDGRYLQRVRFRTPAYAAPPSLSVGAMTLVQGRGIVVFDAVEAVEAQLAVVSPGELAPAQGHIAVYDAPLDSAAAEALFRAGAVAIVAQAPPRVLRAWDQLAARPPRGVELVGEPSEPAPPARTVIYARPEAIAGLKAADGQPARFAAPRANPVLRSTYNVLGVIHGTAPDADTQAVLLSAHYDHLGVLGGILYPGANDDASGTAAVLEFARMLATGKAPRRTVRFALFGCEEAGGHGAKSFLAHPPTPLTNVVANLEFEMIGVPDPADRKALMLTGWERTNLGPALRDRGASIGPDNYPAENFFRRSDNYQLARRGVVAQTVTAWPVPPTYHRPTDTLDNVDLGFMAEVIQSLAGPIRWLLESDFRPEWNPGGRP